MSDTYDTMFSGTDSETTQPAAVQSPNVTRWALGKHAVRPTVDPDDLIADAQNMAGIDDDLAALFEEAANRVPTASVNDYECPVCGLAHGHSDTKHDIRADVDDPNTAGFNVREDFAELMEFNPACHCGLNELAMLVDFAPEIAVPMFKDGLTGDQRDQRFTKIRSAASGARIAETTESRIQAIREELENRDDDDDDDDGGATSDDGDDGDDGPDDGATYKVVDANDTTIDTYATLREAQDQVHGMQQHGASGLKVVEEPTGDGDDSENDDLDGDQYYRVYDKDTGDTIVETTDEDYATRTAQEVAFYGIENLDETTEETTYKVINTATDTVELETNNETSAQFRANESATFEVVEESLVRDDETLDDDIDAEAETLIEEMEDDSDDDVDKAEAVAKSYADDVDSDEGTYRVRDAASGDIVESGFANKEDAHSIADELDAFYVEEADGTADEETTVYVVRDYYSKEMQDFYKTRDEAISHADANARYEVVTGTLADARKEYRETKTNNGP